MTLRDALDFALTSLRGNLAKSLLTVLGLGVGVGAVLTVLSLGDAGESAWRKKSRAWVWTKYGSARKIRHIR